MVDDQQAHALHLGGRGETKDRLAVAEGADALIDPALGGDAIPGPVTSSVPS